MCVTAELNIPRAVPLSLVRPCDHPWWCWVLLTKEKESSNGLVRSRATLSCLPDFSTTSFLGSRFLFGQLELLSLIGSI